MQSLDPAPGQFLECLRKGKQNRQTKNVSSHLETLMFKIWGLGRKDKVTYQHLSGNVADNRGTCQNAHQNQMGQWSAYLLTIERKRLNSVSTHQLDYL